MKNIRTVVIILLCCLVMIGFVGYLFLTQSYETADGYYYTEGVCHYKEGDTWYGYYDDAWCSEGFDLRHSPVYAKDVVYLPPDDSHQTFKIGDTEVTSVKESEIWKAVHGEDLDEK